MQNKRGTATALYCVELFGGGILAAQLFRNLAFRSVPGLTLSASNIIFWSLLFCLLGLKLLITPLTRRNKGGIFAAVNTPVTIYFLISYFQVYRILIVIILCVLAALLISYSALVVSLYVSDYKKGVIKCRISAFVRMYLHRCGMIMGISLSVVFLALYLHLILGGPTLAPNIEANDPRVNEQKISNNIETLLLLQEEKWDNLSVKKRLNILQTVANIEATYLGLPHELNVTAELLEEGNLGCYIDNTHSININLDFLASGSAHELVETLAHEAYHAYQYRLVDLYKSTEPQYRNMLLLYRASIYKEELGDYINGNEDFIGYSFQIVEIDSDAYALATVDTIYKEIDDYLNSKE